MNVARANAGDRGTGAWLVVPTLGLMVSLLVPGCGGTSGHQAPAGLPGNAVRPVPSRPPAGTLTQVTPEPLPPKEAPRPAKAAQAMPPKGGPPPAKSAPIPTDSLRKMELKHAPPAPSQSASGDYVYVEVLAEPITRVAPIYPEEARSKRVDGTVHTQVLIGKDGLVRDVRIIKSIPLLDSAAVAAVRQWTFKPARGAGKPVSVWMGVPIKFSLR